MTQPAPESEQPFVATVTGVTDSDITRNLVVAVVSDIYKGDAIQTLATFTSFLQAIGYSERRAE